MTNLITPPPTQRPKPQPAGPHQNQQKKENHIKPGLSAPKNQQKKVNLLIINPSPRNIKPFEVKLKKLNQKYDIYREKYNFNEINAYTNCRDFFLSHPEYTHMAILPDDLLVDVEHVDKLVDDLEKYDYDVLSGVCNFALSNKRMFNKMAVIDYRIFGAVDQLSKTGRFDYFKHIMSRDTWQKMKEDMKDKPNRIIRVALSNFPFTIIKRSVVEKIEFGSNLMGVDTVFFQSCINNNIATYADLDVEMFHIKGIEDNRDMTDVISYAFDRSVNTKINYIESNPPKHEQIFLPKVQQTTE